MNIDEIEEIISEKELIEIQVPQSVEISEDQELLIWGKYKFESVSSQKVENPINEKKPRQLIKKPKGKFFKKLNKKQIFQDILDEIDGKKASSKFKHIIYIFESKL